MTRACKIFAGKGLGSAGKMAGCKETWVGGQGDSMGGVSFFYRGLNPNKSRAPLAASSSCGLPAEHPGQGQVLLCPSAGGHFGTWLGLRS